jgi:hypothetical protein
MEMQAKAELVGIVRERYLCASRKDKSRILDEFVAVTGNHRKHAVRLLSKPILNSVPHAGFVGRKIYHDAVREVIGNAKRCQEPFRLFFAFARLST